MDDDDDDDDTTTTTTAAITSSDAFGIRSKIDFWNNRKNTDTSRGAMRANNTFEQHGKVKRMVASIEKSMDRIREICSESRRPGARDVKNMSDIMEGLFELQIRLRYDLSEIDWPSTFIGKVTQTDITFANVNIVDD